MNTFITLFIAFFCIFSITKVSGASLKSPKTNLKPLVLPIRQDAATSLLIADIYGRTPVIPVSYIVDLTALHVWANCETNYKSTTYSQPKCGSPQCKVANTSYCFNNCMGARPFCHTNTCGRLLENPVSHQSTIGEVSQDIFVFRSTDGSKIGPPVQIPDFLFTCAPSALVDLGLPKGVQGVAGLAQGPISLQNHLALKLGLKPIFTMCIPPTPSNKGVVFFGWNGPYTFSGIDASKNLIYTPLTISYFGEYYINVKSIKINQKIVPVKNSLLSVKNVNTAGGTTFNTLLNYTILEGSIFKALISSYTKALPKVPTVKPISPFGLCYESKNFPHSPLGPVVPSIDLELEGQGALWKIFGVNSMVEARPGVLCLAFVNGGNFYRAAVNIGTYQMKNIPLEFDLSRFRLGIGYPLSGLRTGCQYFNFTVAG